MSQIFKVFFGIIGVIVLIYVLFVIVRTVLTTGAKTVITTPVATTTANTAQNIIASGTASVTNTITTFSFMGWLNNWHPLQFAPVVVSPITVVPGSESGPSYFSDGSSNTAGNNSSNSSYNYWSTINDAPNDHPTDWAPVDSVPTENTNTSDTASVGDSKYIQVSLNQNSVIKENQVITGYAYYQVFTNRIFPLAIIDDNGRTLGVVKVFANGQLQANGFIGFRAVLDYYDPTTPKGYLVFKNDNVSDVGFKAVTVVPVFFSANFTNNMPSIIYNSPLKNTQTNTNPLNNNCVIGGCSMQFCMDQYDVKNTVSTCEWRPAYACYKNAICERNSQTGKCGWRIDSTLASCLQNNP